MKVCIHSFENDYDNNISLNNFKYVATYTSTVKKKGLSNRTSLCRRNVILVRHLFQLLIYFSFRRFSLTVYITLFACVNFTSFCTPLFFPRDCNESFYKIVVKSHHETAFFLKRNNVPGINTDKHQSVRREAY